MLANRVFETTTSTGTGNLTLSGAVSGFRSFSVFGTSKFIYVVQGIEVDSEWEIGLGTYSGGTLTRNKVIGSSNSNNAVNFSAGSKRVFNDVPSDFAMSSYRLKEQVEAVASTNVDIETVATIQGVTVSEGKRFLLRGQTTASQNGIYVGVNTSANMERASDLFTGQSATGTIVLSKYDKSLYVCGHDTAIVGTNDLTFVTASGNSTGTNNTLLKRDGTGHNFKDATGWTVGDNQKLHRLASYTSTYVMYAGASPVTFDLDDSDYHEVVVDNDAYTFQVANYDVVQEFVVVVKVGSIGGGDITWWNHITWLNGTPSLAFDPGDVYVFRFWYIGVNNFLGYHYKAATGGSSGIDSGFDNKIARYRGSSNVESTGLTVDDDNRLTAKQIKDTITDVTGDPNFTIDPKLGRIFRVTLDGNRNIDITNTPIVDHGETVFLLVKQDGTGGHTPTFTDSICWFTHDRAAPTIPTGANITSAFKFVRNTNSLISGSEYDGYYLSFDPRTIKLDDFATPDDNTDLNASTTRHGLLPKLGGGTTNFLRADGTWNAPTATPSGSSGQLQFNNSGAFGGAAGLAWSTSSPNFTVTAQGAAHIAFTLQAAVSQTAAMLRMLNSSGGMFSQLIPNGGMEFGQSGTSGGNDCMAIGPSNTTFKNAANANYHTGRGVSCPSSWNLIAATNTIAMVNTDNFELRRQLQIAAGAVNSIQNIDDNTIIIQGYEPSTQSRTGNGISLIAGSGGTGGNFRGGNILIRAGRNSGNATPATITFQTSPAGGSGSGLQAAVDAVQIDASATADDTRLLLWDVSAGSLKRVSRGASDSGGTGFRLLRVPN